MADRLLHPRHLHNPGLSNLRDISLPSKAVGSAPPRPPPGEQSGGSGLNSSRLKGRSRLALPKSTSFSALSKRVYSEAARVGMGPRSTRGRAIKGRDWIMPSLDVHNLPSDRGVA